MKILIHILIISGLVLTGACQSKRVLSLDTNNADAKEMLEQIP